MTTTAGRPGQRPDHSDHYDDDGVFDLNAAVAESTGQPWHFRWGPNNDVWQLATIGDLDYRLIEAADSGEVGAVRQVLEDRMNEAEPGQWTEFDKLKLGVEALDILFREWLRKNGLEPGESARSSTKSAGTGTRSRQPARRRGGR